MKPFRNIKTDVENHLKKDLDLRFDKATVIIFVVAFLNFFATTTYANYYASQFVKADTSVMQQKISYLIETNQKLAAENEILSDSQQAEQSQKVAYEELRKALARHR